MNSFICSLGLFPDLSTKTPIPIDPFAQILTLGGIWIIFHCFPMCGPLVAGLQLGRPADGGLIHSFFLFHVGKGIAYASLGAAFGAIGAQVDLRWLSLGLLILIFGLLVLRLLPHTQSNFLKSIEKGNTVFVTRMTEAFRGRARPLGIGFGLAFLPCALLLWALGLAAATQSAFYGACLMLFFLGLTSLPIGVSLIASRFAFRQKRFRSEKAGTVALTISFLWMLGMNLKAWGAF